MTRPNHAAAATPLPMATSASKSASRPNRSRSLRPIAFGLALLAGRLAAEPALAMGDMYVTTGAPTELQAGLSAEFSASVTNRGDTASPVELFIILAGKLGQPEHIRAGGGFDCEVRHDTGINAAIRCTGPQLAPGTGIVVIFHARGLAVGRGQLVVTADPDHSVPDANYEDNIYQSNVTFN